MNKELTEISPDLTIPGGDVTVHSPHSCQVRSQDGRYGFSVEIDKSGDCPLKISGNIVSKPWRSRRTYLDCVQTEMRNARESVAPPEPLGFSRGSISARMSLYPDSSLV
jgi:hypothetical protein